MKTLIYAPSAKIYASICAWRITSNFSSFDAFFRTTFQRSPEFALKVGKEGTEKSSEKLVEGLTESQKKILMLVARNPSVSKKAMAQSLGISTTAIDKNLAKLKAKGVLRRVGPAKGGHWDIVQSSKLGE
ncbi:MAG: hypothetical protein COS92_05095 [Desulfobacterales bacterium CG07_land_8_20_14_0_80_52_14]|nr:MAG: hypothetical protein COX20_04355 [Desulfobacterales bacterium CG23_combo_of_CG06-09_8_20_14_all_52_9]PIU49739.1 MAG: hypothetical protein COS92_05095 [Desulfobacterales bacterium CG07_land_8_20_14_0_80_52_14]